MGSPINAFSGAPTLIPSLSSDPSVPTSTGLSAYAADLQNALNRSVGLAALPLQLLQNQQSLLNSQSSALSSLDLRFSVLQSTVSNLNSASQNLLSSSVSDQTVISASTSADVLPGTYTILVTDPGSSSSSISADTLPTVTDPTNESISASSTFTLTIDGVPQTIQPAANSLSSLADAINAAAGGSVQATIVNVGPPSAPDYRLSIQSNSLGDVSIQLNDGSTDLLTTLTTGTSAQYQVNGSPATPITTDSRSVTIAPGITVNLLKAGTSTVTVSQSASSVVNAISSFVTAFNGSVDELDKSFGQNPGPLNGQSIVFSLQQVLHSLSNYTGGQGSFTSLTDLGLSFDTEGHLNFDATALTHATGAQFDDLVSFLGNANSGGFLQFATNLMTGVEDPTTGSLKTAISSTSDQISHENDLISTQQDQINQLQTTLQSQMAAADAAIAQIEQQLSFYTGLFQSMYLPNPSQFGN